MASTTMMGAGPAVDMAVLGLLSERPRPVEELVGAVKAVGGERFTPTAAFIEGRLAQLLGNLDELVHRKDKQAALLPPRHDQAPRHAVAVFRGKEQPTLLVEPRRVRPEKHRSATSPTSTRRRPHCLPWCSTILHFTPPSTKQTPFPTTSWQRLRTSEAVE